MVLDFGFLGEADKFQTGDYKSAGSHQNEVHQYELVNLNGTYEPFYTVAAGKTLFVSSIVLTHGAAATLSLATGAPASEVVFLVVTFTGASTRDLTPVTPLKFTAGTIISAINNHDTDGSVTLIGWLE